MRAFSPIPSAGTASYAAGVRSGDRVWVAHPVDIRLSLPLPFGRHYLAVIAGPERRSPAPLSEGRRRGAAGTIANLVLVAGFSLLVNAAAIFGLLVYSSILRF